MTDIAENIVLRPITVDRHAIFASLELSKSTWLVTSLAPGSEKFSRHPVIGGDIAALSKCFDQLRAKAEARTGKVLSACGDRGSGFGRLLAPPRAWEY
jgi:hypothetical protein